LAAATVPILDLTSQLVGEELQAKQFFDRGQRNKDDPIDLRILGDTRRALTEQLLL
jgi:hypothetical protein